MDLSPGMIEVARAHAAGMDHVSFVVSDMESLDFPPESFDVVLSRYGLMLSLDHVAAFRALAGLLVPGGVLAAAVWGPASTQLFAIAPAVLGAQLGLPQPPPGTPTPFSMSDPEKLAASLIAAGFADVSVTPEVVPYRFASVTEYIRLNQEILPAPMLAMARERAARGDDPWVAVTERVQQYAQEDGTLALPSVALCMHARKPW